MRDGEWKLLARLNGGKFPKVTNIHTGNIAAVRAAKLTHFELYRVTEDIDELENVIDANVERAAALKKRLVAIYQDLAETSHHWMKK